MQNIQKGTDLSSVFKVDGQIKMTIAELKDILYEKNKNYFEDKKFDANELNLWLVNIPYDTENVKLKTLQSRSRDMEEENSIIQELGGKKLSPIDDIGDIFTYDSKNIRIIIQPPVTTTDKGPTDISRVIAKFGYLPRQAGLGGTSLPSGLVIRPSNEGVNPNDPAVRKVPFSINNPDPDASYLVKTGVLAVVDDIYLTFAAPLLRRSFFQQNYGVENSVDITPIDLYQFIVKVFTAMRNENSGKILRETLGFGYDGRILEQMWQKEFYRIGTRVLGNDKFLSCDVGSVFGCEGRIDSYVNELEWAIELLRDGEDMQGHKDKFEPIEGKYKVIVKYAKSIAIIDIRSVNFADNTRSEAKNVQKLREDFIHVSCSKDFDAFKIESLGKETVFIRSQD
ncbi:unnamed protein product [Rhizophagus irregularis]|nr:unnamed protein product [Rhizophagus irregularis]